MVADEVGVMSWYSQGDDGYDHGPSWSWSESREDDDEEETEEERLGRAGSQEADVSCSVRKKKVLRHVLCK